MLQAVLQVYWLTAMQLHQYNIRIIYHYNYMIYAPLLCYFSAICPSPTDTPNFVLSIATFVGISLSIATVSFSLGVLVTVFIECIAKSRSKGPPPPSLMLPTYEMVDFDQTKS